MSGLRQALTLPEQLALPGEADRILWAGGDSTLEVIGAADWEAKVYGRVAVGDVLPSLQSHAHDAGQAATIAVAELLCCVILAAAQGPRWSGRLVVYVSDNTNVEVWLNKRTARSRLTRYALRVLQRVEALHHFRVWAAGVGTHHTQRVLGL